MNEKYHIPVLLNEVIDGLAIKPSGIYVDLTFGGGGHSSNILNRLNKNGKLIVFDTDDNAFENLLDDNRIIAVKSNFRYFINFLRYNNLLPVDGILADLGVSSFQFDNVSKGFTYRYDAPLDMRMNKSAGFSAYDVLNEYSVHQLTDLFKKYGEIYRPAYTISMAIVEYRKKKPIKTTGELVKIVDKTSISKPEVLNYTITLNNTGNIVLNTIEVTDILPNGTHKTLILQSGDTNHNNKLDLNEKWVYTTTFIATQDDIDKGNTLTNTANVTTLESPSALGSAQTQIIQQSEYSFRKKTNSRPLFIGDSLVYTFTIKNIGNTRLKVLKITDDNCKSNITLKSESSQQNGILDLNEEQIYTCTSLPITHYEANICEVINIANVAVKTNLSNSTLQEKTSKITTFINVHNSCTCETAILERSPLMPSDSNVPSLSSTSATIQWEDNAFNEIGFEIYKDNILVGTTGKDKTSFTIENLQPRTTYTYTIKSYNEYGTSYRTTITFTTKDDYAWFPAIYNLFL